MTGGIPHSLVSIGIHTRIEAQLLFHPAIDVEAYDAHGDYVSIINIPYGKSRILLSRPDPGKRVSFGVIH